MHEVLREVLERYLTEKEQSFAGNELAQKLRREFPKVLYQLLSDKARYKVSGSAGQGQWTDCPWIAIFDILVTKTPQSGYYPVFLFKADMSGVYLSLNQGVTEVKELYKRTAKDVLELSASNYRAKIDIEEKDVLEIDLVSRTSNARLYTSGNIVARYYSANDLPNAEELKADIFYYLKLYEELAFNDPAFNEEQNLTATEKKQYRFHYRVERNADISKKVKKAKGYTCEACNFNFEDKYGELGREFIEAHHLIPISSLDPGTFQVNLKKDFAVLCSNCHKMIHKLEDASDIKRLRRIIKQNRA